METETRRETAARRGVYAAVRAGALSGVPVSTVYQWARGPRAILIPSVSSERVKLWSWADLIALRAIYWLRHPSEDDLRSATSMSRVRQVIEVVEQAAGRLGEVLATDSMVLRADSVGRVYLEANGVLTLAWEGRQPIQREMVVDLLSPFSMEKPLVGPHLRSPRNTLRIIPGKLAGEPHVSDTRIETRVLASLERRGMEHNNILKLYPGLSELSLGEALDLERQLEQNLTSAA